MFKWYVEKFFKKQLIIGEGKETAKKLKIFGYSLLIGLLVSIILIVSSKINIGQAIVESFRNLGKYKTSQDRLLIRVAIFGLAGIAVGIAFKTGLFNIGVSGQMLFSGLASGAIALVIGDSFPVGLSQILVLVIAILAGATLAAIAGALKAYFGIHEVVSTILLNWIAYFFYQAAVKDLLSDYFEVTRYGSEYMPDNFLFTYETSVGKMGGVIALILLILVSFGGYFLIYKTSLGYKMVIVGHNPEAAKASGINTKLIATTSMAISGAVAGVLGIVIVFIRDLYLRADQFEMLPTEGFDGIAIAILGFSNPLAILPVAFIFGFIQTLISNSGIFDPTINTLVMGIFIFVAAINTLFINYNFRLLITKIFLGKNKYLKYQKYVKNKNSIDKKYYDSYNNYLLEWRLNKRDVNKKINDQKFSLEEKLRWRLQKIWSKNILKNQKAIENYEQLVEKQKIFKKNIKILIGEHNREKEKLKVAYQKKK